MKIVIILVIIFFVHGCGGSRSNQNEQVYLPNMKFKRTENPNYYHYFPKNQDTIINKSKHTEPIPKFKSQVISSTPKIDKKSQGFFSSVTNFFNSNNIKTEEEICTEILDINKKILVEQNSRLESLISDKTKLIKEINDLQSTFNRQDVQNSKENQRLKKEIKRLNDLIKILSTELE